MQLDDPSMSMDPMFVHRSDRHSAPRRLPALGDEVQHEMSARTQAACNAPKRVPEVCRRLVTTARTERRRDQIDVTGHPLDGEHRHAIAATQVASEPARATAEFRRFT